MRLAHPTCLILAAAVVLPAHAAPPPLPNRVTILYDAFGGRAGLTQLWHGLAVGSFRLGGQRDGGRPGRIHHSHRLAEAGHVGAAGALPSAANAERAHPARGMLPPGD